MTSQLPVLIVGAGISGLALAQGLQKASISFHLYERDPSLQFRPQGYRVRISDPGLDALEQNLDPSLFSLLIRCSVKVSSKSLAPSLHLNAVSNESIPSPMQAQLKTSDTTGGPFAPNQLTMQRQISADRAVLREILIKGIEEKATFGRRFVSYSSSPNSVTAKFDDGSEVIGSLLVATDGAWSHIRQQLLQDHHLYDTNGRLVFGKTPITADLLSVFNKDATKGLTLIRDAGDTSANRPPLALLLESMHFPKDVDVVKLPADYVYWVLFLRKDFADLHDDMLLHMSQEETAKLTQDLTRHWHPSLKTLLAQQDPSQPCLSRIITVQPDIPAWNATSRVALIGDAVHVMAPTAAIGATTALRDTGELQKLIVQRGPNPEAVQAYMDKVRQYGGDAVRATFMGGKVLFGMEAFEKLDVVGKS